eukprot:Nitzschia sp. Nitz4//scaffold197_size40390//3052//7063//NITZ4_007510-RA/size40390-snap-gene-0.43-mRNA-1//1//CDS//3329540463//1533//frame0
MKRHKPFETTTRTDCSSHDDNPGMFYRSDTNVCSGESTSGTGSGEDNVDEVAEVRNLVKSETKSIQTTRIFAFSLLLGLGIGLTTTTYILLNKARMDEFENSFDLFANAIGDAMESRQTNLIAAFDGLSKSVASNAETFNMKFPFINIPNFEAFAEEARRISLVEGVGVVPFVSEEQREEWNDFSWENQFWVDESREYAARNSDEAKEFTNDTILPDIMVPVGETTMRVPSPAVPLHGPVWHLSPPPFSAETINSDIYLVPTFQVLADQMLEERGPVMSHQRDLTPLTSTKVTEADHIAFHEQFLIVPEDEEGKNPSITPHSLLLQPLYEIANDYDSDIVGIIYGNVPWDPHVTDLLPDGVNGIVAVLYNSCNQSYSYELNGNTPTYLGVGNWADKRYHYLQRTIPFLSPESGSFNETSSLDQGISACYYGFHLYPTQQFQSAFSDKTPELFAACVAFSFILILCVMFLFDVAVKRRNEKVVGAAVQSNALVSSMFPSTIRQRMLEENINYSGKMPKSIDGIEGSPGMLAFQTKPIADLYIHTSSLLTSSSANILLPGKSVMIADIVGFTAWSSVREPTQVFVLLESVFKTFDMCAKKRRVFKVETVGDCYVAVCGLPNPAADHASRLVKFSLDCLSQFLPLVSKLEVLLGPDTGDLGLKIGIHSGPVTAGVLRGDRSRFQLFGDTMNTASRIASTGETGCIHVSKETADRLVSEEKETWIVPREEAVQTKGKGELHTYWVALAPAWPKPSLKHVHTKAIVEPTIQPNVSVGEIMQREERLVNWNRDVLLSLLQQIEARRRAMAKLEPLQESARNSIRSSDAEPGRTVLDEVVEIIPLPQINTTFDDSSIVIPLDVVKQLHSYVSVISARYHDNPFHNFEHASHVTMSVAKLLSRIVAPSDGEMKQLGQVSGSFSLHDHTYGITSDPLTQFACILSALIHDVEHTGVPNTTLIAEHHPLATIYKGKSVAEQNSVDVAWKILMQDGYKELRDAIYQGEAEYQRFRQLVVNSVMATDIVDKELKAMRNGRWDKAFALNPNTESARDVINRKATIVIEHLIQASDVSHTMQHWHIYRKWNNRLFDEMYRAYINGHAEKNPADFWYQGEIGFFDFYIIPLAKKLKDCGVFGVSSDEYLLYAMKNREEWHKKGPAVVAEMLARAEKIYTRGGGGTDVAVSESSTSVVQA